MLSKFSKMWSLSAHRLTDPRPALAMLGHNKYIWTESVLIILIIGKIENKALEKRFTVFDVGHLTEICVKICEKAILLGTATNLIHPDLT